MLLIRLPLVLVAVTLVVGTVMGAEEEPYGLRGTPSFLEDANPQGDVKQYECTMAGSSGQDACDVRVLNNTIGVDDSQSHYNAEPICICPTFFQSCS